MKKLILLIALVASPVFAQEEEQEVQIEIQTGGGVEVSSSSGGQADYNTSITAFPDKSIWSVVGNSYVTYCWVDENEEPRCKQVRVED